MEKVSIITPCFNGENYITNYLESVLSQSYPLIELIFVDDASVDKTEEIVKSFVPRFYDKGYTLLYIKQEKNKGQAAAMNRGLRAFTGEYLAWIDSDDILLTDAIAKKVDFLKEHSEVGFVLNWGIIVKYPDLEHEVGLLQRQTPVGKDNLFEDLLEERNVVYGPGTILVRGDCIRKVLPDLTIYESKEGQNWQLMLPLAYTYKCGYLEEVLFKYVWRDNSHSHSYRTYEREIERRENFFILQTETIKRIASMPECEKNKWIEYSYNKQLRKKYLLAKKYGKYNDCLKYEKELMKF